MVKRQAEIIASASFFGAISSINVDLQKVQIDKKKKSKNGVSFIDK